MICRRIRRRSTISAMGTTNIDLIMAMNAKLNDLIAEEVGGDDGSFLPIRDGKWFFPPEF